MKQQSLFSSVIGHILDRILGRKYYFVLMRYPNIRVRGNDATVRPLPLCETSSNIFFSHADACEYCERFRSSDPSEYIVSVEVHSFRSHAQIPHWSKYLDNEITRQGYKSRLI